MTKLKSLSRIRYQIYQNNTNYPNEFIAYIHQHQDRWIEFLNKKITCMVINYSPKMYLNPVINTIINDYELHLQETNPAKLNKIYNKLHETKSKTYYYPTRDYLVQLLKNSHYQVINHITKNNNSSPYIILTAEDTSSKKEDN